MADFCNICIHRMFGRTKPDIDVIEIFNELTDGYFMPVLCEGCGMTGIAKKDGKLLILFDDGSEEERNIDDYVESNKRRKLCQK